jgi:hypothetical protein
MREALLVLAESAADPRIDAVLEGRAPAGRTLRLRKDFTTDTKEHCDLRTTGGMLNIPAVPCQGKSVPAEKIPDFLEYTTTVPASGRYEWHVTPSTRPFVRKAGGTETWTLTCLDGATVVETRQVSVERGQRVTLDVPCGTTLSTPAAAKTKAVKRKTSRKSSRRSSRKACLARAAKVRGSKKRAAARKRCVSKARPHR